MITALLIVVIGLWIFGKIGEYRIWKQERDRYLTRIGW